MKKDGFNYNTKINKSTKVLLLVIMIQATIN